MVEAYFPKDKIPKVKYQGVKLELIPTNDEFEWSGYYTSTTFYVIFINFL